MSTTFDDAVENIFLAIEQTLEMMQSDIDFESHENRLHIYVGDIEMILSRQTALQELWLACPLGGYHFQFQSGEWITQQKETLPALLSTQMEQLTGEKIQFSF